MTGYDTYPPSADPQGSVQHADVAPPQLPPRATAAYLPNVITAIAASAGVIVGSVGPWASCAQIAANCTAASPWWQRETTGILGAAAGIALSTLLVRGRGGPGTRWLAPLVWLASFAGLVCLLIALISILDMTSASPQLAGLKVGWGVWLVAVSGVVLCATASVAGAQVGLTEGSRAGVRAAIAISVPILLGVSLYFPLRWAAVDPRAGANHQLPIGSAISASPPRSVPPAHGPATATSSPQDPELEEVQQLWLTAVQKRHPVQDFLAAAQSAGVTGLEPALLENGYNVCWQLWFGGYDGVRSAVALHNTYPTVTLKQAAHFVLAAYDNLCPVRPAPGAYDWWEYGTGGAGGGGGAAGG